MEERNKNSDLIEFIQKATKLGKYNSNTGGGILNAVKAAEKGLSNDEPKEMDYLLSHMEELFYRQKDINLSPQSLAVYFARIKKAVSDYKKYGSDAKAIYSWSPKPRTKKGTSTTSSQKSEDNFDNEEKSAGQNSANNNESVIKEVGGIKLNVVTWRLRPGLLVKIELPEDLTKPDVERMKKLLDLEIESFE
ncbi:MAG: hypothetical protein WKF85_09255 [Chitinophagaceae bacterium]